MTPESRDGVGSERWLALTLVMLAACDPGVTRPTEPAWNKQACSYCSMLLSDKQSAAQLTLAVGERRWFDDVGCMVRWLDEEHAEPRGAWVRSPGGEGWIAAESARFTSGAKTPMDFGFLPAASGLSFDEVKGRLQQQGGRSR